MLVSTINEHGKYKTDDVLLRYAEFHINKVLSVMNQGKGGLDGLQQELNLMEGRKNKENLKSTTLLDDCCESLLNNFNSGSERIISSDKNFEKNAKLRDNEGNINKIEELSLPRKIAADLGWGSDEETKYSSMDNKLEISGILKSRPCPMRFSPDLCKHFLADQEGDFHISERKTFDGEQDIEPTNINSSKRNSFSQSGAPTTSKNIYRECKVLHSPDSDTTYDNDFNFGLCANSQLKNGIELFDEKHDIPLNSDLISEYEDNLELEIVKNNVCLAMDTYESEIFPLKSYEVENGICSWNFCKDNFDNDTRESFSLSWNFDGQIESPQDQISDAQVITPKKTVDITKIKGWRKKQFTLEKSLSSNFDNISEMYFRHDEWRDFEELSQSIVKEDITKMETEHEAGRHIKDEASANYAFVCDRLDNFLAKDAELKIDYEIPHLYAECGIKLTSEDLISNSKEHSTNNYMCPQTDFSRLNKNSTHTELLKFGKDYKRYLKKGLKNKCSIRCKSNKKNGIMKKENNFSKRDITNNKRLIRNGSIIGSIELQTRRSHNINMRNKTSSKDYDIEKRNVIGRRSCEKNHQHEYERKVETQVTCNADTGSALILENMRSVQIKPEYKLRILNIGMVLYPGPFAPLNPFIQYHLRKIRSYETLIDRKWATFAVSAIYIKNRPENRRRMILPLTCCFKNRTGDINEEKSTLHAESINVFTDCSIGNTDFGNNSKVEFHPNNGSESEIKDLLECLVNVVCEMELRETEQTPVEHIKVEVKVKPSEGNVTSGSLCFESSDEELSYATLVSDVGEEMRVFQKNGSNSPFTLTDCGDLCLNIPPVSRPNEENVIVVKDSESCNLKYFPSTRNFSNILQSESDILFEDKKLNANINECMKLDLSDFSDIQESGCFENSNSEQHNKSFMRQSEDLKQPTFSNVIAKLLARKLNEFKYLQNITNSIDNLKYVKPNVLELIKLNFIKENFLSGYVNIWYKKPENGTKSRAFLTFSMNPPMEGAVNLKMISRISRKGLPKIINDMIARNNPFDSNDFAILFCDGKLWEIHGSVNFSKKNDEGGREFDDRIQIFHLAKKILPELQCLKKVHETEDRKVTKWWIMNMLQEYTEIEIKAGTEIGTVTRAKVMQSLKFKVPNFIEFKGTQNARPIGIVVNWRFWPYFLIGPYCIGENHELSLKLNSKNVPFEYSLPLDRVKPNFLLKRFVSSIIMHSWRNRKQVVEMWLYDRTRSKRTSFIEIRTRSKKLCKYQPSMEHNYSLTQAHDRPRKLELDSLNSQVMRYQNKNIENKTQKIYLVSNIPNLGYLKGELHPDQSVVIEHPLKPSRRVKSHRIGEWLNRIMKRRIRFIPNNLDVKWTIVKNGSLLEEQKPLNRFSLGGTHILCQKGLFYLLSMTKEEIMNLGLDESSVLNAIADSHIIKEVTELKELGKLLLMKDECNLQMCEVLQLAVSEIEKLQREEVSLRKLKNITEREREFLCRKFIKALQNCVIEENVKNAICFYVKRLLQDGREKCMNEEKRRESVHCLEIIDKFLQESINKSEENLEMTTDVETEIHPEKNISVQMKPNSINNEDVENRRGIFSNGKKDYDRDSDVVHKLETKIMRLYELLHKCNSDNPCLFEKLTARLNMLSKHLSKIKSNYKDGNKRLFTYRTEIHRNNSIVDPNLFETSPELYISPRENDVPVSNKKEIKFRMNNLKKVPDSAVKAEYVKNLVYNRNELPACEKRNINDSSRALTVICCKSESDLRVKRIIKPQMIRGSVSILKKPCMVLCMGKGAWGKASLSQKKKS